MSSIALDPEFAQHLLRIIDISEKDLDRLVAELLVHWSETVEEFVRRHHRELQGAGVPNRLVYGQIGQELKARPVRTPELSVRQVRRIIYG